VLRDLGRHRLRNVPGLPANTYFPAIDLDGAPLWGFTYRLLADWLGLTVSAEPSAAVAAFLEERGCSDLARLCAPGPAVLAVNRLEVGPEGLRIWGPDFEEHAVHSRPA
jgi:hypothetical protein